MPTYSGSCRAGSGGARAQCAAHNLAYKGCPESNPPLTSPYIRTRHTQDPAEQAAAARALDAQLAWLAEEVLTPGGPWALSSASFSLADCAVVPFILRLVRGMHTTACFA